MWPANLGLLRGALACPWQRINALLPSYGNMIRDFRLSFRSGHQGRTEVQWNWDIKNIFGHSHGTPLSMLSKQKLAGPCRYYISDGEFFCWMKANLANHGKNF